MIDSKACILRTRLEPDVINLIEYHIRPHCLSSLRAKADLNQECVMAQLRECIGNGLVYWKKDSAVMFVYACIEINNKYGWA